jgi:hypothetical protein
VTGKNQRVTPEPAESSERAEPPFLDVDVAKATLAFIDARRGSLLLHAGACADASGRAVVVHGGSGAGKTTLTAQLAMSGLAYLTDETVCLDPVSLAIEPFPKPLTVKPGSQSVLSMLAPSGSEAGEQVDQRSGNWQVPASVLVAHGAAGGGLPRGVRPAVIVFPDFDASLSEVAVAPVSRARAAYLLGEQSSALWAVAPRPLGALTRLVSAVPAYRVSYGVGSAGASLVASELLPARDQLDPASVAASEGAPAAVDASVAVGPRWRDGLDWVVMDGETVLFDGAHLHHLDASGTAVWVRLDGTRDVGAVASEIATDYGADERMVLIDVEDLVRVMTNRGLLTE